MRHPVLIFWITAGWLGFLVLPWYMVDGGLWSFEWLVDGYPFDDDYAPAAFLIAQGEKLWLAPLVIPLALPLLVIGRAKSDPLYAKILILAGALAVIRIMYFFKAIQIVVSYSDILEGILIHYLEGEKDE